MCNLRRWIPVLCVGLFLLASTAYGEDAEQEKLKAVLWTGGAAHDYDAIAKILVADLPKHLPLEMKVVRCGKFLDEPDADKLDVLLMNHCYKGCKDIVSEAQQERLLTLIREGTGVVSMHCAFWSFNKWDEYRKLFGSKFTRHGRTGPVILSLTDRDHPITKDLPAEIEVTCELYHCTELAEETHVLATQRVKGTQAEFPAVWTRTYGKGRVVTILPPHTVDSHRIPDFQRLTAASMRWAAGQDD